MDINDIRAAMTVASFLAFIGVVIRKIIQIEQQIRMQYCAIGGQPDRDALLRDRFGEQATFLERLSQIVVCRDAVQIELQGSPAALFGRLEQVAVQLHQSEIGIQGCALGRRCRGVGGNDFFKHFYCFGMAFQILENDSEIVAGRYQGWIQSQSRPKGLLRLPQAAHGISAMPRLLCAVAFSGWSAMTRSQLCTTSSSRPLDTWALASIIHSETSSGVAAHNCLPSASASA